MTSENGSAGPARSDWFKHTRVTTMWGRGEGSAGGFRKGPSHAGSPSSTSPVTPSPVIRFAETERTKQDPNKKTQPHCYRSAGCFQNNITAHRPLVSETRKERVVEGNRGGGDSSKIRGGSETSGVGTLRKKNPHLISCSSKRLFDGKPCKLEKTIGKTTKKTKFSSCLMRVRAWRVWWPSARGGQPIEHVDLFLAPGWIKACSQNCPL